MSELDKERDPTELIFEALDRVTGMSTREAALKLGVSHDTVAAWRRAREMHEDGVPASFDLQPRTRRKLEAFVRNDGRRVEGSATADEIIRAIGDPEYIRRQAGVVSTRDWAQFGYRIALRRKLPPEEMRKMLEWMDEIAGKGATLELSEEEVQKQLSAERADAADRAAQNRDGEDPLKPRGDRRAIPKQARGNRA